MKRACITYEGESASELFEDFKGAIDMYLEHCQRKEVKPEKPYNDVLNIHIPSDMHIKIVSYAENHGTSIDDFILDSIEKRLEVVDFE
jgi:predicted HicB family RNase H-like nuclease